MPDVITKSQTPIAEKSMPSAAFLVVAAGRGTRAGEGLPKQYRAVAGKPLIRHTLEALARALPGAAIQVVIHADDRALFDAATQGLDLPAPAIGGETRQDSVQAGLAALSASAPEFVLVHDAARPFIDAATVAPLVAALEGGARAVLPATAVTDTLKAVKDATISHTVDRTGLYAVQTPQAFPYAELVAAHASVAGKGLTDDGAVMEAAGAKVQIVEGNEDNFKVTNPGDFQKAEQKIMMQLADVRTGMGYDVHRFEDGDHVWLCGVKLPHTKGLKGHSDADVGLHALTDAILAALCDGDIGIHFPPSDNQWRGAPSHVFLEFARDRVRQRGGAIAHVGVLLICERPKIGPHKDALRARIAEILDIPAARVSVQATTTEKLGFTGREEGIAAQATATVRLPFGDN
ncbi:MAG: bifunctional 2-C-methyl-D-erythritol 4-phosphate cytidylyltransferase/2-C-methyl-D-erythritol 2,4-cyclodiphosphate synthase [Alphaproteobacteria bacterium]|nr:MAG: bifunctional 2-C-methyl-D-erythritol 4-phosphate cytidylyltransferase/2-C-methyl-D-erythritol 2,4-cyclodiphosphate synthase [Alphaproteobacteria bacterium]